MAAAMAAIPNQSLGFSRGLGRDLSTRRQARAHQEPLCEDERQ